MRTTSICDMYNGLYHWTMSRDEVESWISKYSLRSYEDIEGFACTVVNKTICFLRVDDGDIFRIGNNEKLVKRMHLARQLEL